MKQRKRGFFLQCDDGAAVNISFLAAGATAVANVVNIRKCCNRRADARGPTLFSLAAKRMPPEIETPPPSSPPPLSYLSFHATVQVNVEFRPKADASSARILNAFQMGHDTAVLVIHYKYLQQAPMQQFPIHKLGLTQQNHNNANKQSRIIIR